jgi:hypothetical protein
MSDWLLQAAVTLNDGRRVDALTKLAQRLDVHVDTVRRWVSGAREIPKAEEIAVRSLVELKGLKGKLAAVWDALES